jgi:hypothetical protein
MDRLLELVVAVVVAAFIAAAVDCVMYDSETEGRDDDQTALQAVEHANGCPLDAVSYDAPAFADHDSNVLKVTDRFGGQSWWMVKMGTEWVVLPIEGKEAVDVG